MFNFFQRQTNDSYRFISELMDVFFLFFPCNHVSTWRVFNFFQRQTNDSYRFISELMDVLCMAGVHQQPEHCLAVKLPMA